MSLDDCRDLILLARRGGRRSLCVDRTAPAPVHLAATASSRGRPTSARAAGSCGPSRGRAGSKLRLPGGHSAGPRRHTGGFGSTGVPGPRLLLPVAGGGQRSIRPTSAVVACRPHRGKEAEDPLQVFKEKLDIVVEGHQSLDHCEKPFFRPALWEATWKNHEDIVRLLADKRASVCVADYQGRTPLHEAAYYGHGRLVEFLLERGHPIDYRDTFGQTPLFRAVEAGRHAVVERLVARRAEVSLLDGDGVTVQHVASFQGQPQLAEWLLYQGAFKNRLAVDDYDDGRALPLSARIPKALCLDAPPPQTSKRKPHQLPELPRPAPAPGQSAAPPETAAAAAEANSPPGSARPLRQRNSSRRSDLGL